MNRDDKTGVRLIGMASVPSGSDGGLRSPVLKGDREYNLEAVLQVIWNGG